MTALSKQSEIVIHYTIYHYGFGSIDWLADCIMYTVFGALSLLGIASGVANLGFVFFILSSLISMCTTYFTILFLAETASLSGRMTTESLAARYLGDAGKFVTQFLITIGN